MSGRPFAGARRLWLVLLLLLVFGAIPPDTASAADGVSRSNAQVYTIINTVKLENRSARSIYNINLDVPLAKAEDMEWQEVLGEEFSPQPQSVTIADDGRRLAHYVIPELKAGDTLNLVQRVAVRNFCVSYDASAMNADAIPAEAAVYLAPSENINSDNEIIQEFAITNTVSTGNPYLKARLLFAAVNKYLTYDNTARGSHSAITAYWAKSGNCEDYANLYAAALRSVGIPARVVNGYLYGKEAQTSSSYVSPSGHINADKMRHSWVVFYISGVGWLAADPTFSYESSAEEGNITDWNRFARITNDNRLIYTDDYLPDNNRINYDYQGAAPLISYNSELALYSLISPFRDIVNHWAAESVLGLYYYQPPLVTGLSANYFGVNDTLTRAEFATMLNRVLDRHNPLSASDIPDISYTDLVGTHWAYTEIAKAVRRNIISGYPDNSLHPDDKITRAEAAVMLNRVLGNTADSAGAPYEDVTEADYGWALSSISTLYQQDIMKGVTDNSFAPAKYMTRGEGATVIYRWLKSAVYYNAYLDY